MRFQFFKHNDNNSVILVDNEAEIVKIFIEDFITPAEPEKIIGYSEMGAKSYQSFFAVVVHIKLTASEIPFNTFRKLMGDIVNAISMAEQNILEDIEAERMKELKKEYTKETETKTDKA